jgi:hypothetical protein
VVLSVPALPDRASGIRLTAAIYKSDVTDASNFLANPPIFVGYQTAVQSVPNATFTALSLDSNVVDTYAGHSNTVNNSRYTPPAAGWYLVIASYGQAGNGTGNRFAQVFKNGLLVVLGQTGGPAAGVANGGGNVAVALVQCNGVSDYVEAYAYQSSGGALNTNASQTGLQVIWAHA